MQQSLLLSRVNNCRRSLWSRGACSQILIRQLSAPRRGCQRHDHRMTSAQRHGVIILYKHTTPPVSFSSLFLSPPLISSSPFLFLPLPPPSLSSSILLLSPPALYSSSPFLLLSPSPLVLLLSFLLSSLFFCCSMHMNVSPAEASPLKVERSARIIITSTASMILVNPQIFEIQKPIEVE